LACAREGGKGEEGERRRRKGRGEGSSAVQGEEKRGRRKSTMMKRES